MTSYHCWCPAEGQNLPAYLQNPLLTASLTMPAIVASWRLLLEHAEGSKACLSDLSICLRAGMPCRHCFAQKEEVVEVHATGGSLG